MCSYFQKQKYKYFYLVKYRVSVQFGWLALFYNNLVEKFVLVVDWRCWLILLHNGIQKFVERLVQLCCELAPRNGGTCLVCGYQPNNINMCRTITPWNSNINTSNNLISLTPDLQGKPFHGRWKQLDCIIILLRLSHSPQIFLKQIKTATTRHWVTRKRKKP